MCCCVIISFNLFFASHHLQDSRGRCSSGQPVQPTFDWTAARLPLQLQLRSRLWTAGGAHHSVFWERAVEWNHTDLQRYESMSPHNSWLIKPFSNYISTVNVYADFVRCRNISSSSFFLAIGCPAPELPPSVQISCSPSLSSPVSTATPHPLSTACIFSCDEGFELRGALQMECVNTGQWSSSPPTCTGTHKLIFPALLGTPSIFTCPKCLSCIT